MRVVGWGVAVAASAMLLGCGLESGGRVAILDLDRVAKAIGRDDAMARTIQEASDKRQANVEQVRKNYLSQLTAEKEKIGRNPSQAEQDQLNQMTATAETRLRGLLKQGEQEENQLRVKLIQDLRDEVEPVVRRVAAARNLDVVMLKQAYMLYVDATSNITDDVIDTIQSGAGRLGEHALRDTGSAAAKGGP